MQTVVNVVFSAVATTSKFLGHSRADVYDRYYQSRKVKQDVQAAFLETAEHKALIRALGNMSLTLDSVGERLRHRVSPPGGSSASRICS